MKTITFQNGGVDLCCADVDRSGDVDLNGVVGDSGDARMLSNYFLYGIDSLAVIALDASVAASDANKDGETVTVADLVYLYRLLEGNEKRIDELGPYTDSVRVRLDDSIFSVVATDSVGALYAGFLVDCDYKIIPLSGTQIASHYNDPNQELRILINPDPGGFGQGIIPPGSRALFTLTGAAQLNDVQVSDRDGNLFAVYLNDRKVPLKHALAQNVPNPFDSTTQISLYLPHQEHWVIEITDYAGGRTAYFSGSDSGHVVVYWNPLDNFCPGYYKYRCSAGAFSSSRLMILGR